MEVIDDVPLQIFSSCDLFVVFAPAPDLTVSRNKFHRSVFAFFFMCLLRVQRTMTLPVNVFFPNTDTNGFARDVTSPSNYSVLYPHVFPQKVPYQSADIRTHACSRAGLPFIFPHTLTRMYAQICTFPIVAPRVCCPSFALPLTEHTQGESLALPTVPPGS